ncbi:hypothetical protein ACS0TY_021226 [Phlomoides rotata]
MKHTQARNVVERTFDLLKMRWGILHSPSWYPIKMANEIIMACCFLHNYIRLQMEVDPLEGGLDEYMSTEANEDGTNNIDVESHDMTPEWTTWRDNLAQDM